MKLDLGMHIVMHLVFFGKNRCDSSRPPLPLPTAAAPCPISSERLCRVIRRGDATTSRCGPEDRGKRGRGGDPHCGGSAEATTALAGRTELQERGDHGRQEDEEEDDKWGPQVSDRGEKLQQSIHIRIHLQLGPS
jgi:hypothetical protein